MPLGLPASLYSHSNSIIALFGSKHRFWRGPALLQCYATILNKSNKPSQGPVFSADSQNRLHQPNGPKWWCFWWCITEFFLAAFTTLGLSSPTGSRESNPLLISLQTYKLTHLSSVSVLFFTALPATLMHAVWLCLRSCTFLAPPFCWFHHQFLFLLFMS